MFFALGILSVVFGQKRPLRCFSGLSCSGPGLTKTVFGLPTWQQRLHIRHVRFVYGGHDLQTALSLLLLLGEDVILESVLALEFTGSRLLESLLGAGNRFHLRHGLLSRG